MTQFLPNHATIEFSTRIELLLQQKGVLRGTTEEGTHVGKQASPINQFGTVEAQAPAGRFEDLNYVNPTATRRWVFPTDREIAELVDKFDLLRTIEDPKGKLAESFALAMGRYVDSLIINAANATAYIGETGVSTEAWDTTYEVANSFGAGAATGLNVAKLVEAQRIFMDAKVDLNGETPTLVIGPQQYANLLNQAQVSSRDFGSAGGVLESGKVTGYMGMRIKPTTLLNKSGNDRACLSYVPSGIHLGVWQDVMVDISEIKHKSSQPWQIYTKMTAGATRTQLGKVVVIQCTEV